MTACHKWCQAWKKSGAPFLVPLHSFFFSLSLSFLLYLFVCFYFSIFPFLAFCMFISLCHAVFYIFRVCFYLFFPFLCLSILIYATFSLSASFSPLCFFLFCSVFLSPFHVSSSFSLFISLFFALDFLFFLTLHFPFLSLSRASRAPLCREEFSFNARTCYTW